MIVNESCFTQEECLKSSLDEYKKRKPFFYTVLAISLAAVIASIVVLIITGTTEIGYLLGFAAVISIVLVVMLIRMPLTIKKNNQVFKGGVKYLYTFYDDKVTIACKMTNSVSKKEFKYTDLVKVHVIKDGTIRIFMNKYQFYPLKPTSFKSEEDKKKVYEYLKIEEN